MGGLDLVDAPGSAELQLTKEMATATMRTTTAAAITTVAIAVKQQPKMEKLGQNSANNANAWTLRISLITAPNVTKAKINVVWQTTKAMATVTTKTSEPSCVRSIGSLIIFIGISIDHNKIS